MIAETEYRDVVKQNETLIAALKPFAFMWQNRQTDKQNWKDCYSAQRLLLDLMGTQKYLEEAESARR